MVVLFPCPANFYLPPSPHQAHLYASCSRHSPAWPTAPVAPRLRRRRPRHSAPPHWFTCGRRHCRRACRPPIVALTGSGYPALSISWWTSAGSPRRSPSTASSLTSGRPRPRRLRLLATAGLPCCAGPDAPSPLPSYEAGGGGGNVEAVNAAPGTGRNLPD